MAIDPKLLDQLLPLYLREVGDRLDNVFIHRVGMIHIELHHRDDVFKLGDEGTKHTQFIHPAQGAFRVAVFQQ